MTDTEIQAVLQSRLAAIRERVTAACKLAGRSDKTVSLIAVSKTVSVRVAALLAELGQVDFAESRPQQLWEKALALPNQRWHLIGHLQRNKLDRTLPLTAMLHSVDSLRLLDALHAAKATTPLLLEFNCSREAAKNGFAPEAWPQLVEWIQLHPTLNIAGLMTMAAYDVTPEQCRATFAELRGLRDQLQQATGLPLPELSMGMSGDFEQGIAEGSTMIRLGSVLFEDLGNQ